MHGNPGCINPRTPAFPPFLAPSGGHIVQMGRGLEATCPLVPRAGAGVMYPLRFLPTVGTLRITLHNMCGATCAYSMNAICLHVFPAVSVGMWFLKAARNVQGETCAPWLPGMQSCHLL